MTVSSGAWYRTGKVTLVNGSKSIVGTDTFWLSSLIAVAVGDIFSVDSATWYEVTSVSADGSLELDRNFEGGSAGPINYAIIRNTSGTVLTRIAGQIAVQFNQKQLFLDELRTWLNSVNTTENVTDSHGVSTAITTPAQMESEHSSRIAQVDTLVNGISAMTKAEFFALAEKRKADSAGSGFSEWGKHYTNGSANLKINEGLWTDTSSRPNTLLMNRNNDFGDAQGVSRSTTAITNINGVMQSVKGSALDSLGISLVKFPNAPNGTETYDTNNGNVVQHASAELAFASETATNKVITSRQDFVFLESFHEKISDKNIVYPLGNVQYGATNYEGITLGTNGIAQRYSAFGEWDTTTTGNGATWSTLSDADKEKFIQDPENNIYSDGGELIQVRYRVRVVKGLGDVWKGVDPSGTQNLGYRRIDPQGQSLIPTYDGQTTGSYFARISDPAVLSKTNGQFTAIGSVPAHNGLCFAIPIALVQRRNTGAYHPVHNSNGCMTYVADANSDGLVSQRRPWYSMESGRTIRNQLDCFGDKLNWNSAIPSTGVFRGYINDGRIASDISGRSDGKFYDAIYASDVSDLRMSSKKLPLSEIREKYKRMAISGEVRGFEGVPFTKVLDSGANTFYVFNTKECVVYDSNEALEPHYFNSKAPVGSFLGLVKDGITHVLEHRGVYQNTEIRWQVISNTSLTGSGFQAANAATYAIGSYFGKYAAHKQANPTWTDIIGSVSNIAATFPDGVEGQWIPLIPDGTSKVFPFNRKLIATSGRELTDNNGAAWTAAGYSPSTTTNSIYDSTSATRVDVYHYETQAHFTSDVGSSGDNSKVLDLGGVYANSDGSVAEILCSGLIGKIPTETWSSNGNHVTSDNTPVSSYFIHSNGNTLYSDSLYGGAPEHGTLFNTNQSGGNSPALKTLDYLSHDNNVAKLCYAYKEMVWDVPISITVSNQAIDGVSGQVYQVARQVDGVLSNQTWKCINSFGSAFNDANWVLDGSGSVRYLTDDLIYLIPWGNSSGFGDNNKFEITNNQSTLTDDNGNSVLYGSASFNTQYFIVDI
jgi:hypothetical protein